jgi:hypothetical protein
LHLCPQRGHKKSFLIFLGVKSPYRRFNFNAMRWQSHFMRLH